MNITLALIFHDWKQSKNTYPLNGDWVLMNPIVETSPEQQIGIAQDKP